jgi:hypothetical protein
MTVKAEKLESILYSGGISPTTSQNLPINTSAYPFSHFLLAQPVMPEVTISSTRDQNLIFYCRGRRRSAGQP